MEGLSLQGTLYLLPTPTLEAGATGLPVNVPTYNRCLALMKLWQAEMRVSLAVFPLSPDRGLHRGQTSKTKPLG